MADETGNTQKGIPQSLATVVIKRIPQWCFNLSLLLAMFWLAGTTIYSAANDEPLILFGNTIWGEANIIEKSCNGFGDFTETMTKVETAINGEIQRLETEEIRLRNEMRTVMASGDKTKQDLFVVSVTLEAINNEADAVFGEIRTQLLKLTDSIDLIGKTCLHPE